MLLSYDDDLWEILVYFSHSHITLMFAVFAILIDYLVVKSKKKIEKIERKTFLQRFVRISLQIAFYLNF